MRVEAETPNASAISAFERDCLLIVAIKIEFLSLYFVVYVAKRQKDRKISVNTMQKEGIFVQKLRKMQKKLPKYLHISKKSSNFAPDKV